MHGAIQYAPNPYPLTVTNDHIRVTMLRNKNYFTNSGDVGHMFSSMCAVLLYHSYVASCHIVMQHNYTCKFKKGVHQCCVPTAPYMVSKHMIIITFHCNFMEEITF